MKRFAALAAILCLAAVAAGDTPARAQIPPVRAKTQLMASDTYYVPDVPAGTMSVRVEATVESASAGLGSVRFYAMPGATNVKASQAGDDLTTAVATTTAGDVSLATVTATLKRALRGGQRANLVLTYDVPVQDRGWTRLQPGAIESIFVSQGAGSFVFLDLPAAAENYLDPGCLKTSDQPASVKNAGHERWVCGETLLIALASGDPSVQRQCADAADKCRQRIVDTPLAFYAETITDVSTRGQLDADITLAGGKTIKATLRYFKRDQAWADRQMVVARDALPRLEAVFGFPYPYDRLLMRQSFQIERIGAAGIAFDGNVLLVSEASIADEVTIHELAHQWAGLNLETNWLWEGLAEYATRTLAPEMKVNVRDWRWEGLGYKDPIGLWWNGSPITIASYWYGKSGAFWLEYANVIGGREAMAAVLGRMDDDPKRLPLDGRWFMDRGEEASGANLDELFLTWVWNRDTAAPLVRDRRAAHDAVKGLRERAAAFGLSGTPPDIQQELDSWTFGGVDALVARAGALLKAYEKVAASATAAGLDLPDQFVKSWPSAPLAKTEAVLNSERNAISAITQAAVSLEREQAGPAAFEKLDGARAAFARGDFPGAQRLAAEASSSVANSEAAVRMVDLAHAKQGAFKPNFFTKIGLLGADPRADLVKADEALAAGDAVAALRLSRMAYEAWDGAQGNGLKRLAIAAASMCALAFACHWLAGKLRGGSGEDGRAVSQGGGHTLAPPEDRLAGWREWENHS